MRSLAQQLWNAPYQGAVKDNLLLNHAEGRLRFAQRRRRSH
ncbi:hypothetical protein ABN584_13860 [Gloeocapsa sp. BRSZ]